MSAIAAIYHRDGAPAARHDTQRMLGALYLHGPRKQGEQTRHSFGLVWTSGHDHVPEDMFDRQPMNPAPHLSFVFVGFLYGRDRLCGALNIAAVDARKLPDSALVQAAWVKWGTACFDHLYGDYAFIVCDAKADRIYAARGPNGALPLYYHVRGNRLVISSAASGIFALGDVDKAVDETRLADQLVLNNQDNTRSFFEGIAKIPLGHCLECSGSDFKVWRHFSIADLPDVRFKRDADYVEAAQELLARNVKDAMRRVGPPVSMISAGLDASTVAAQAIKHLRASGDDAARLTTFTSVPEPGWDGRAYGNRRIGDESGPVRAFAQMYPDVDVRFVDSAGLSLDRDLDQITTYSEAPQFAMGNLHWLADISRQAHTLGATSVLTGQSGNMTLSFSGKSIYPLLLRTGRWRRLYRELQMDWLEGPLWKKFYRRAVQPLVPQHLKHRVAGLRGKAIDSGLATFSAINPDYVADMGTLDRMTAMDWDDTYEAQKSPKELMERMLTAGIRDVGQGTQHAMQMMTGVAARDPLGTREMVAFCYGLPVDQFIKDGVDRRLIKQISANDLPPEILGAPRGRQGADWHLRMTRDLPRFREEIERLEDNPGMAHRLDLPRMKKVIDTWPDKTPLSPGDHPDYKIAMHGLSRALSAARFVNWVEGRN